MHVLVTYNTRSGHTRSAGKRIAEALQRAGDEVVVKPVTDVTADDVATADLVFAGTWVHGLVVAGVRPAGVHEIATLPPLGGKPAAVFCTYAVHPRRSLRRLEAAVRRRDARIVAARAMHRDRIREGLEEFVETARAAALPAPV